jgi:hypothetical protein
LRGGRARGGHGGRLTASKAAAVAPPAPEAIDISAGAADLQAGGAVSMRAVCGQAAVVAIRRRARIAVPIPPKPTSMMAQVAGSGTDAIE